MAKTPGQPDDEFPVVYSNFVEIRHATVEFLIDFKRIGPETPDGRKAPPVVRLVLHPVVAKSFQQALAENVRKYEDNFGPIPQPPAGSSSVPIH